MKREDAKGATGLDARRGHEGMYCHRPASASPHTDNEEGQEMSIVERVARLDQMALLIEQHVTEGHR